jgi:hypothetical protein
MEKPTQLLPKHIAAYQPYGLKFIDTNDKREFELFSLYPDSFSVYSESEPTRSIYFDNNTYPTIKPALRPLSDFNTFEDRQHGYMYQMTYNVAKLSIDSDLDIVINESEFPQEGYVNLMVANEALQALLRYHFDIYGLIDADLAVDINTLN